MNASDQKRLVLVGSLSLTALLVGSVVGGLVVWRTLSERLGDAEYLQRQLAIVAPESGGPRAGAAPALEEQDERITRSVIVAPFDGVVVVKHAELGGHVTLGTPIVDVVSRGEVDALLMVPELLVNLIGVGQDLPIGIDPLGTEVHGKVISVTPYGPTASRTFPVRVRLDDQGGKLKVGMSVTASIPTGPKREALVVTRDAVLVRPDGSTVWVAVPKDKAQTVEVQPVPVSVTARMEDEYAVEPETDKGRKLLTAGTAVVVEGAERLMPGQQVRIVTLGSAGRPVPPTKLRTVPGGTTNRAAGNLPAKRADSRARRQES